MTAFIIVIGLLCLGVAIYGAILSVLVRIDRNRPRPEPKRRPAAYVAPWDVDNLPRGKRD